MVLWWGPWGPGRDGNNARMALLTRLKIWLPGDILYAADINGEVDNILNDYNGNIQSVNLGNLTYIPFSGSLTLRSGGTDYLKFSNSGIVFGGALSGGWVCNLGMSYSAGTFTVTDASQTTLSATNPGFICTPVPSGTGLQVIRVTAGPSFKDDVHASSDLTGIGFGITEAVAYANAMPFFLYAAVKSATDVDGVDGNSALFFSRKANLTTTPSSTNNIGTTNSAPVTDDQDAIFVLGDFTKSNYTSVPCVPIGAFRMTWSAANTDWTVAALAWPDGMGKWSMEAFYRDIWAVPLQQFGASASTHMLPNGGTAPVWSSDSLVYQVGPDPFVTFRMVCSGDGGTDGAGAVQAQVALPFVSAITMNGALGGYALGATTITGGVPVLHQVTAGSNALGLRYQNAATTTANITNAMFSAGGRNLELAGRIPLL